MNVAPRIESFMCPCCGGFIGEAAPIDMVIDKVSRATQKIILSRLAKTVGRPVNRDVLIDLCYGDDADGGPEDASGIIHVSIHHVRKTIAPHGWYIERVGGGVNGPASYRLIPMEVRQ